MNNKSFLFSSSLLFTLGLSAMANADVTIEQKFSVDAGGALSMAAMHGTTVTAIGTDKSRTDSDVEFKSGMMRAFAGGVGKTTTIVRLDEERIINVDYEKKRYSETTFAAMRAQTEQAMQQMEEMRASQEEGQSGGTDLPVTEDNCEWSEATVETIQGGKEKIAGMKAQQTITTATQTCLDAETGKSCDLTWTLEQWLAPKAPGGDEALVFWQSYAEKLGLKEALGQEQMPSMMQLFSQYGQGWDEIEKQPDAPQGYPVKTAMQLEIGGEECTMADGQPLSAQNVFGDSMTNAAGGAAAEGVGSAAGGAIGGIVAKGLFSAFGKKKKAEPEPMEQPATGSVRLFRFESETTKIKTKRISDKKFEIPAGFKPAG
jgi:hypothetical protein